MKSFLEFKKRFFQKLEAKASWGKNELKDMFLETVFEVMMEENS